MKLVFPNLEYEDKAIDFINEFNQYSSEIHGESELAKYIKEVNYQKWVEKVSNDYDPEKISKDRVPGYTFFYVNSGNRIIGMINIRLELNDFLFLEGGHIGYCIRPTERKKGYGTKMLKEGLKFCKEKGLNEVLITCDKVNIASAGVIKSCGGKLENEIFSKTNNEVVQRYWIKI